VTCHRFVRSRPVATATVDDGRGAGRQIGLDQSGDLSPHFKNIDARA